MTEDGRFVARALFRTEEPIYGFLWAWGKLWASTQKRFGYVQPDVGQLVEIDVGQVPQLGPLEAGWRGVWLLIWLKDAEGKRFSRVSIRGAVFLLRTQIRCALMLRILLNSMWLDT